VIINTTKALEIKQDFDLYFNSRVHIAGLLFYFILVGLGFELRALWSDIAVFN
jgi:hypothetical protein